MRRLLFLLILCLFIGQSSAQTDTWSVWLYEAQNGRAVQIENTGVLLNDLTLPVPAPFAGYTLDPNISISPDGNRIAYAVTGTTIENERISSFLVFDATTDSVLFSYDTPTYAIADSLIFSKVTWNSTGNIVAFAYATGETPDEQKWRILVLNAIDGRIISELDDDTPYFASQEETLAPYLLPIVQFFGEATVGFSLIPYQTANFSDDLFSYEWDIVTGRVVQMNRAPRITGETLPQTGETISPMVDERVNYDTAYAPYSNAIQVYRPEIGARVPFFASQTYDILRAQFVQNGEQVLAYAEDLLTLERRYLLVNRIGILRGLPAINAINNGIVGTPDGFVYVADNPTPVVLHLNSRDETFPQAAIWIAPENSRFVPVWASSWEQSEYEAWLQLAPPVFPSQIVIDNVTSAGIDPEDVTDAAGITGSNSSITVDSVAVINTSEGDRLNMRDNAGLSSTIIARVDSGIRVVVTDGPVAVDGFTWWQIRLPTGQVGWVVERAEGVQTLLPAA